MKFRILAALAMLLLSAPSALGVQRALAPTRGDLAGWLAALGIELAYLSLAFIEFDDQQRQRNAARVAKTAVATAIVLNVLADYAARVPVGLTGATAFLATFDWLLLALSVLESAPLAGLAYTLAVLLHTRSSAQQHTADAAQYTFSTAEHPAALRAADAASAEQMLSSAQQHPAVDADAAQHSAASMQHLLSTAQHSTDAAARSVAYAAASAAQHTAADAQHPAARSYRCPRCGAALTQQQYAAARRYGYCAKCK